MDNKVTVKVVIDRFSHHKHDYELINSWLKKHNQPKVKRHQLPQHGFVAYYQDMPVAMGFVRRAEGNIAIFDSLISNPDATGEKRHLAIDAIVEAIFNFCRRNGYQRLIAFSINSDTLLRSEKHGFKKQPHTVVSVNLEDNKWDS